MKAIVIDDRIELDEKVYNMLPNWQVVEKTFVYLSENKWKEVEILWERNNMKWVKEFQTERWWYDARCFNVIE